MRLHKTGHIHILFVQTERGPKPRWLVLASWITAGGGLCLLCIFHDANPRLCKPNALQQCICTFLRQPAAWKHAQVPWRPVCTARSHCPPSLAGG